MSTLRKQIIEALSEREMDPRGLSQTLGRPEKEILAHLPHAAKSVRAQGQTLVIVPPRCPDCGFVFKERNRFTRPGRCPECKATRVEAPRFHIKSTR
jgi:hypothetical protein